MSRRSSLSRQSSLTRRTSLTRQTSLTHAIPRMNDKELLAYLRTNHFVENIADKFKLIRVLGKGYSCEVYEAQQKSDGQIFALKKMPVSIPENLQRFYNEVNILAGLKHQNIVKFHDAYIDRDNLYITTEMACGGPLLDRISKCRSYSERKASEILREIVKAVKYLHEQEIVHRDIKPGNLVFGNKKVSSNLLLIDFGDAIRVDSKKTYNSTFGTLLFLPPEINRERESWELKKHDMWSIGIVAYILVTGRAPFVGTERQVLKQIVKFNNRIAFPKSIHLSSQCKDFIRKLLNRDCSNRLSAQQALTHDFLRNTQSSNFLGERLLQTIGAFHQANVLQNILVNALIREMTEEQKKLMLRAFEEIDTKGKGYVEKHDLVLWLIDTGFVIEDAKARANELMECMDADKDGKVTFDDFVRQRARTEIQSKPNDTLKHLVGCEENEDRVSLVQLRHTIDISCVTPEEKEEAEAIIRGLDTDESDESVSVDRFFIAARESSLSMASINTPTSRSPSRSRNDSLEQNQVGFGDILMPIINLDQPHDNNDVKSAENNSKITPKSDKKKRNKSPVVRRQKTQSKFMATLSKFPKYPLWNPNFKTKKASDKKISEPAVTAQDALKQLSIVKSEVEDVNLDAPEILRFEPMVVPSSPKASVTNKPKTDTPEEFDTTESWDSDTIKDILRTIQF